MDELALDNVRKQIAALAEQDSSQVEIRALDFTDPISARWIQQFKPVDREEFKKKYPDKEPVKLTPTRIVSTVFRRLGVSSYVLSDYILSREPEFMEQLRVHDARVEEAGRKLAQLAPAKRAFPEISAAFSDFFGTVFDEQLDRAQKFGLWLIEDAASQA